MAHSFSSSSYLSHLAQVRDAKTTNQLRQAVKWIPEFGTTTEPLVFYFEGDPEVVYHAFLFGFPEIMSATYHFSDNYNLVATSSWSEIVSAYTNGEALKRFYTPVKPAMLKNIYAYKVQGGNLIDITAEKRRLLQQL